MKYKQYTYIRYVHKSTNARLHETASLRARVRADHMYVLARRTPDTRMHDACRFTRRTIRALFLHVFFLRQGNHTMPHAAFAAEGEAKHVNEKRNYNHVFGEGQPERSLPRARERPGKGCIARILASDVWSVTRWVSVVRNPYMVGPKNKTKQNNSAACCCARASTRRGILRSCTSHERSPARKGRGPSSSSQRTAHSIDSTFALLSSTLLLICC